MQRKNSVFVSRCRTCRLMFETKVYSSHFICETCRPPKHCAHGIATNEPCLQCFNIHRSRFMRVGVR